MTDFLNCPLPLYEGFRREFERQAARKATAEVSRGRAHGAIAAINELNEVVGLLRVSTEAEHKARRDADELRKALGAREQELNAAKFAASRSGGFERAYHQLRQEFDRVENEVEAQVEQRVRERTAKHTGVVTALRGEITDLKGQLAAASRENHFIDARAYAFAFLIGALASAVMCVAAFSTLYN